VAKDIFVAPGCNLFVQFGALRLRGEEQEAFFNKCLLLFGGELLLCRDSLGTYVDDALIPGENPSKNFTFLGACEGGNERHVPGSRD
jgi:hypothetical protein